MSRKMSLRNSIGMRVALFLLAVAGVCFLSLAVDRAHSWHGQRFDCPVALRVDFSIPGTYTASIHHWPWMGNYAVLGLDVPGKVLAETPADVLVGGLQGTYSIRGDDGQKIFWGALVDDPNNISECDFANMIQFRRLDSWYQNAKWQIDVTVTHGAPRLKGVPQRLVLIDRRTSFGWRTVIAWFTLVAAAIVLIVVVPGSLKTKKRLQEGKQTAGAD